MQMPRKFRLCAHHKNEYRQKRCAVAQNPIINPGPVASNSSTSSTEMTVSIPLSLYTWRDVYNQCLTYIGEYLLALIYLLVSLLYKINVLLIKL